MSIYRLSNFNGLSLHMTSYVSHRYFVRNSDRLLLKKSFWIVETSQVRAPKFSKTYSNIQITVQISKRDLVLFNFATKSQGVKQRHPHHPQLHISSLIPCSWPPSNMVPQKSSHAELTQLSDRQIRPTTRWRTQNILRPRCGKIPHRGLGTDRRC